MIKFMPLLYCAPYHFVLNYCKMKLNLEKEKRKLKKCKKVRKKLIIEKLITRKEFIHT